MRREKRKRLESNGWRIGTAREFLAASIEGRLRFMEGVERRASKGRPTRRIRSPKRRG